MENNENTTQPLVIEYAPDEDHWDVYHLTMEAQDALAAAEGE